MVAEWVDGVQLTALDDLKAIGASPARAMQTTVEAFASQIFRSGFLHGMSSDDRTVIANSFQHFFS
jgi:aarF domain-containing kinase